MTPADREQAQDWMMRRYLQLRFPTGTRRRTDTMVRVKRYSVSGDLVGVGTEPCEPRRTTFLEDRRRETR